MDREALERDLISPVRQGSDMMSLCMIARGLFAMKRVYIQN